MLFSRFLQADPQVLIKPKYHEVEKPRVRYGENPNTLRGSSMVTLWLGPRICDLWHGSNVRELK